MPIAKEKFEDLPKVTAKDRKKGGKKVDWPKVLDSTRGQAWSIKEVHQLVNAECMLVKGTKISRTRVYRWLNNLEKKRLAQVAYDEGTLVFYVK